MISDNQKFIDRMELALSKMQAAERREERRAKALEERARAELELFMDDLVARNIDPQSAKGKLLLAAFAASGGVAGLERLQRKREEIW